MSSLSNLPSGKIDTRLKGQSGLLKTPLSLLNDPEGEYLPACLPFTVDAHVHLFPDHLFAAVWLWFEQFGWPIRYRLTSPEIIDFLLSRGVNHIVALHYAHKLGLARELNDYMAKLSQSHPGITAMATVFPGEKYAADILEDAFQSGLKGVKLHSHIQCFEINSRQLNEIYEVCTVLRADRIIFGTDFPNLPYAWDREIRVLIELDLPDAVLEKILGKNAMEFYSI